MIHGPVLGWATIDDGPVQTPSLGSWWAIRYIYVGWNECGLICGLICSSVGLLRCDGRGVSRRRVGEDTARRREGQRRWREAATPLHARVSVRATLTGVRARGTLLAAVDADAASRLAFDQLAAPACVARVVHALELNSLEVAVGGLAHLSVQARAHPPACRARVGVIGLGLGGWGSCARRDTWERILSTNKD